MHTRRLACFAVVLVLFAGACGDDGGDGGATATGDTTTTTAEGGGGEDQELAESAVLVASDLPAGFAESAGDQDDTDGEDEDDPFERCVGSQGDEVEDATSAEAEGSEFEKEQSIAGSASVVLDDEAAAREAMELLGSERLKQCFNEAFAEGVREGIAEEGGQAPDLKTSLGELSFPEVGDEVVSYRGTIQFSVENQQVQFPVDVIFARKGRTIGFYFFGQLGEAFPLEQEHSAIEKALERVDD